MDNIELKLLLLSQLANCLWDHGTYLNERQIENDIIKLYFFDEKYFEIYITKEKERITKITEITLEDLIVFYNPETPYEEKQLGEKKQTFFYPHY